MSKHSEMSDCAKYIAWGMVIGSAVGTAAAVMMTTKKKKPEGFREKALSAACAVGDIVHSIANMAK